MPTTEYFGDHSKLLNIEKTGIDFVVGCLFDCINSENSIWIIGNGGSAAQAEHLACDLLKNAQKKAISLCSNNSLLLAIGNDWNGPGYNSGASNATHGKQDITKIYNRALSAAEVRQNYNKYKTRFNLP